MFAIIVGDDDQWPKGNAWRPEGEDMIQIEAFVAPAGIIGDISRCELFALLCFHQMDCNCLDRKGYKITVFLLLFIMLFFPFSCTGSFY